MAEGRGELPGARDQAAPTRPVLPDFADRCLTRVVPALVAHAFGDRSYEQPSWMPAPVLDARQVVLLVLDGLGAEQLALRRACAPVLASGEGTAITSVAPSTTATALTTLTTGLAPAVHGTVGYRVAIEGSILNLLSWRLGDRDARRLLPPRVFQPFPSFPGAGGSVPVVSRNEYATTGFTASHLGDASLHGWHTPSGLVVEVCRLVQAGAPFVYAYYDGVDRAAHAQGLGEHYEAELRTVDRLVGDLIDALPSHAALVVTADHGQVEVGSSVQLLGSDIMGGVTLLSGEGRFRWLHARAGAAKDVADAAAESFGAVAWVYTRDEILGQGWLGGEPSPDVGSRLGDVALVPFSATAFLDPADTGEQRLVSRHGSLTPDEMWVPFVAWHGARGTGRARGAV